MQNMYEEVGTCRKINLDHTLQCLETQKALDKLCEDYTDIHFVYQSNKVSLTYLHVYVDTWDYPHFA